MDEICDALYNLKLEAVAFDLVVSDRKSTSMHFRPIFYLDWTNDHSYQQSYYQGSASW